MSKKVIAIDFDDVIAGFNLAYAPHSQQMYGSKVTYSQIVKFDMSQLYGVPAEEIVNRVRLFCHNHHDDIEPIDGTVNSLRILANHYELHIVTSRCQTLRSVTEQWLKTYEIRDCFDELHFTNGFGSVCQPRRTKLEVCQQINAQVLIEDAPSNALMLANAGIPVLLPDRPWNQEVSHVNILRYGNWAIVRDWLQKNL